MDMFPDTDHVRDMQKEMENIIRVGVYNITQLLKNTENSISMGTSDDEDEFEIRNRQHRFGIKNYADEEDEDDVGPSWKKSSLAARRHSQARKTKFGLDSARTSNLSKQLDESKPLTGQLLETGILTKDMLAKLQKEFSDKYKKKPKKK